MLPILTSAILSFNDQKLELKIGERLFRDELYVEWQQIEHPKGKIYRMMVHPKQEVVLKEVKCSFKYQFEVDDKIYLNGFQSWTESREYGLAENIPDMRGIAKPYLKNMGDYTFYHHKGQNLHAWGYSYVRNKNKRVLIGSLSEHTGYTLMQFHPSAHSFTVEKDCANLTLSHSYPALDIVVFEGTEDEVFDSYFQLFKSEMPFPAKPIPPKAVGWTSWYEHYTKIDKTILKDNFIATDNWVSEMQQGESLDYYFQVDDGWQAKVGDWLDIKPGVFEDDSIRRFVNSIHARGLKAGLWLAPFLLDSKSKTYLAHPDWVLKDEKGKPIKIGYNPLWNGWFYALDIYHPEARDYMAGVFHHVVQKWDFDLVKLDFLYAAAVKPRKNKTRGQVMHDAMCLLRQWTGEAKILGCGVPIVPAFGMVDYCRIGQDVHLKWEHGMLKFARHRERVSTKLSIQNSIWRSHLNARAFGNDPDVFIMRDKKNKLTQQQKQTLFMVNALTGQLNFTSDNYDSLQGEKKSQLCSLAFMLLKSKVLNIEQSGDLIRIQYSIEGKRQALEINIVNGASSLK